MPSTRTPGFILLGKALEVYASERLNTWTQREIFAPLAMHATGFCPAPSARASIPPTEEDAAWRKRRIQGEVQDENAWVLDGVAGHAGLFSNVPDLLRFSAEILRAEGANALEKPLLPRQLPAERVAQSPSRPTSPDNSKACRRTGLVADSQGPPPSPSSPPAWWCSIDSFLLVD